MCKVYGIPTLDYARFESSENEFVLVAHIHTSVNEVINAFAVNVVYVRVVFFFKSLCRLFSVHRLHFGLCIISGISCYCCCFASSFPSYSNFFSVVFRSVWLVLLFSRLARVSTQPNKQLFVDRTYTQNTIQQQHNNYN